MPGSRREMVYFLDTSTLAKKCARASPHVRPAQWHETSFRFRGDTKREVFSTTLIIHLEGWRWEWLKLSQCRF